MTDYKLPDLPSDEELGISGMDEDESADGASGSGEESSNAASPGAKKGGGKGPPKGSPGPATVTAGAPAWSGWVTLAVLLVTGWFSSGYRQLPSPAPATAPDTVFAAGRALPELVELARAPRPPGSPEHARVRGELVAALEELGLETRVQVSTPRRILRNRVEAATVRNVLARLPGQESTGAVVLMAHYDGVPSSPAAGDDGSGLVSILETVRALRAGPPLRNDVVVLFTDAEELGLLGARAFADEDPWMADVRVVLNVEMRGTAGPSILFETGDDNGWVVERFQGAVGSPVANSATMALYERLPYGTDFTVFRDLGVQGLNFAAIGAARHYHEATDRPDVVRESSLQHQGDQLLALTRALGGAELNGDVSGPDRIYTALPVVGLVSLPATWSIPLTLGILAALLLVTFLASVRGARSRGFLAAAVLSSVVVGLSALAGWGLTTFVLPLSELYTAGGLTPVVPVETPWRIALVATVVAVVVGLFSVAHRWMSPLEATLGALLLPVLALLATTLLAPLAAVTLQAPLAATTVLLLLLTGVGLRRARGTVAWVASLILAVPVLAVLVPVYEMVFLAFTLQAAPVLGAAVAMGLLLILPALSALERPNRWWAPATALGVALLAGGWGWVTADPSAERPAPSVLQYAMERDDQGIPRRAAWATRAGAGSAWAAEAVNGEFGGDPSPALVELAAFGLPDGQVEVADAPLAAVPPPEVQVLSDRLIAGDRRVRLSVRSRMGAEVMTVELGEGLELLALSGTQGESLHPGAIPPSARSIRHWGEPDPVLVLEVSAGPGAPVRLGVVEEHFRPGEIFDADRFRRPASLMPRGGPWSDRALVRTPWTLGATPQDYTLPVDSAGVRDPAPATGDTTGGSGSGARATDRDTTGADSVPPRRSPPDTTRPDTTAAQPDFFFSSSGTGKQVVMVRRFTEMKGTR